MRSEVGGNEMSMIGEQIQALRDVAQAYRHNGLYLILNNAADTIESLSAKLAAKNMERSTAYHNNGWIPCKERLPNVEVSENVKAGMCTDSGKEFLITDAEGYVYESVFWAVEREFKDEAIAWMPKPEPYHEEKTEAGI